MTKIMFLVYGAESIHTSYGTVLPRTTIRSNVVDRPPTEAIRCRQIHTVTRFRHEATPGPWHGTCIGTRSALAGIVPCLGSILASLDPGPVLALASLVPHPGTDLARPDSCTLHESCHASAWSLLLQAPCHLTQRPGTLLARGGGPP